MNKKLMNKERFLRKRYLAEKRFKLYGKIAIGLAISFLFLFIFEIFSTGYTAFQKTWLMVDVHYNDELLYIHKKLIEQNNVIEGLVYLQISRGKAERDFAFPFPEAEPTIVLFTQKKD